MKEDHRKGVNTMSTEQNKAKEQRIVAEALNKRNLVALDDCITPDFVYHGPGGREIKGIKDYKQFLGELHSSFPDMQVTIKNILAEDDLLATRTFSTFTFSGNTETITQKKKVTMAGGILDRFEGEKIAETWEFYDRLDMYQQMGLIPANPPTTLSS
jgi:predicted ester cyclase